MSRRYVALHEALPGNGNRERERWVIITEGGVHNKSYEHKWNSSLCLIMCYTMKVCWGVEALVYAFLTSEMDGVKVRVMPKPLYCQGNSPYYTLSRKLGGPQK